MHKRSQVSVKVDLRLTQSRLCSTRFILPLSYYNVIKICARKFKTHVKITRQWKSTLRLSAISIRLE